jgi:aspartyl/asparaginyl beta-hydroxylase (cupin superfamily)
MNNILQQLQDNWQIVREECLTNIHRFIEFPEDDDAEAAGWSHIYYKSEIKEYPQFKKRCPFTRGLLNQLPGLGRSSFLKLDPGGYLSTHSGPHGAEEPTFRGHLALITNPNAYLVVDGVKKEWVEGHWMFFDDEIPHSAHNDGNEARIVLGVSFNKSHYHLTNTGIEYKL